MLGGLFSGAASVIGAMMQAQAQQEANEIMAANLEFQKDVTGEQLELATSDRIDAYGNVIGYNERTRQWEIKLTPQQQRLLGAGEREQLATLTTDAKQARDLRGRQEDRSYQARDAYQEAFEDFFTKQPESEEAFQAEAIGEVARAMQANQAEGASKLNRQALRVGEGGQVPVILNELARMGGKNLPNAILQGKGVGTQRSAAAEGAHRGKYAPQMEFFAKMMDQINPTQPKYSTLPGEIDQRTREMLTAMSNAFNNQSQAVGSAYSGLATTAGQSPDLSGVAAGFGKFGAGLDSMFGGGDDSSFTAPIYDPYSVGGAPGSGPGVAARVGTAGTPSFSTSGWFGPSDDDDENMWLGTAAW